MSEVAEVLEEVETSGPVIEDLSVMPEEEVVAEEVIEEGVEEVAAQPDESGDEKVEITLGEESLTSEEEETAPSWVRDLRKEYKETKKQNRELQKRLEEREAAIEQKPTTLGQKPKLEEFEYDSDKHEAALDAWYNTKNQVEAEKRSVEAEEQRQRDDWQKKLNAYEEKKSTLGVDDYQDSEDLAMETFDQTQQSLILEATDNPALVIYALGKRPEKAKELASIKNPVKLVAAMAKLEAQLKVSKVKTKPAPEKTISGSSQNTGGLDSTLKRLEAEALKSNDYSKVVAYEKELKRKLKAQTNS
jgi:hypothetical protein